MKILISAFACSPSSGSEGGVGWNWAISLSKHHEVVVITDTTRRESIESVTIDHSNHQICFKYYRPDLLKNIPLNSWTAQFLYGAWQVGLLGFASKLTRTIEFDLCIHLTYGVFRQPSFLGSLDVPFIFGPIGGGEDAPRRLKKSLPIKEKVRELLRSSLNSWAKIDPILALSLKKSSLIVTKTEQTRLALPKKYRSNAIVFQEIGIDFVNDAPPSSRREGDPLKVIFAGRLLGWKGIHLAMRAVAQAIHDGKNVVFTIVGSGPFEGELRNLSNALKISDHVRWISHTSQQELFSLFKSAHCLLFPSLHDSSGNVVLEAQAHCLPVICLDLGGPCTLVSPTGSFVISTKQKDEYGVVVGLKSALITLLEDEELRLRMCVASKEHVRTMTWESRSLSLLNIAEQFGLLKNPTK